ncbi:MAG: HPr-rel-A system PqqD family peptide chaperone [Halioglobus sp.]|nr:HPr-rel-A system PqqD family peptide chaperone [Halioglobus sp.]
MKWRAQSTGRVYDPGEGQVVFFDSRSGDTHLLSDVAAHLLQLLDQEPRELAELAASFEEDAPGDNEAALLEVLAELEALDILEQV